MSINFSNPIDAKVLYPYLLPNRSIATLGDSRMANGWNTSTNQACLSVAYWLGLLSGQAFDHSQALSFALAGETTAQTLARVPAVIAAAPGSCIVLTGTNDSSATTDTLTNLESIVAQLLAANIVVFLIAETPRGEAAFPAMRKVGNSLLWHLGIRNWCLAQKSRSPNLYVIDPWNTLANPATATGDIRTGYTTDGLHLNATGNLLLARLILPYLQQQLAFPARQITPASPADIYNVTYNPRGPLNSNPMMLSSGATGVKVGGALGTVADGYTLNNQVVSGLTVTGSMVTDAAGFVWQQIVATGTPGDTNQVQFYTDYTASVQPGDNIESVAAIEVDAGVTSCWQLTLVTRYVGATTTEALTGTGNASFDIPSSFSGVMRAPLSPAVAALTTARTAFRINPRSGVAMNLTVRVRALAANKIT